MRKETAKVLGLIRERGEIEKRKRNLESDINKKRIVSAIEEKYKSSAHQTIEEELRNNVVGLVTREEFTMMKQGYDHPDLVDSSKSKEQQKKEVFKKEVLSFADELEEQENDENSQGSDHGEESLTLLEKRKGLINPEVDTSFLKTVKPKMLEHEKKKLMLEYFDEQKRIKEETIEIKYRYWDGFNMIKSLKVKKKQRIGEFLEMVRLDLGWQYHDLRKVNAEQGLMYVLEEWIIPPNTSFYDLIVNCPKGKDGPLLEVHRPEGLTHDVEKNAPGKIVARLIYEKSRHVYPCSIWRKLETINSNSALNHQKKRFDFRLQ